MPGIGKRSRCAVRRGEHQGRHACSYTARVRVQVRAGDRLVAREGTGAGHGAAVLPGEAHEKALKEAETDAMKRALMTFGNPFGLALYDKDQKGVRHLPRPRTNGAGGPMPPAEVRAEAAARRVTHKPTRIVKPASNQSTAREARIRDKDHLRYVASRPCLVCGRTPSHAHHIRFAQARALARKVSDAWTVPLCVTHHRSLHDAGDEQLWWQTQKVDPKTEAKRLWRTSAG